jgi:hypothetical protein
MVTKHELNLALAKAVLEVAQSLSKSEVMEGSPEHAQHMQNPMYKHFYAGARKFGADHGTAHLHASEYAGAHNASAAEGREAHPPAKPPAGHAGAPASEGREAHAPTKPPAGHKGAPASEGRQV